MILESCTLDGIYEARQVDYVRFKPGAVTYVAVSPCAPGTLEHSKHSLIRVLSDAGVYFRNVPTEDLKQP